MRKEWMLSHGNALILDENFVPVMETGVAYWENLYVRSEGDKSEEVLDFIQKSKKRCLDNARIAAAAPELLDCLCDIMDILHERLMIKEIISENEPVFSKAYRLINAKIIGVQP